MREDLLLYAGTELVKLPELVEELLQLVPRWSDSYALLHSTLGQCDHRLRRLLVDAVNEHHGAVNGDDLLALHVEEHPVLVLIEGRPQLAQSAAELADERWAEGQRSGTCPMSQPTCLRPSRVNPRSQSRKQPSIVAALVRPSLLERPTSAMVRAVMLRSGIDRVTWLILQFSAGLRVGRARRRARPECRFG